MCLVLTCKMTIRLTYLFFILFSPARLQENYDYAPGEYYDTTADDIEETDDVFGIPPPETTPTVERSPCPSGEAATDILCEGTKSMPHPDMGDTYNLCADGSICIRDLPSSNLFEPRCCGNLNKFCPVTGLHSFFSPDPRGYKISYYIENTTEWYKREYKEIGYFGVVCPIPYSFSLKQKGEYLYVPVEWDYNRKMAEKNEFAKQKRCLTNSECGEDNFCDAVWSPSYSTAFYLDRSDDGKPVWFCFKLPKLPENMKHAKLDKGIKICKSHLDCNNSDQICHETQGVSYGNVSSPSTRAPGICVHVDACNANDTQVRGALNVENKFCTDDNSCDGAGISKGNSEYIPHCREYSRSGSNRRICCFEKKPDCRLGKNVTPRKECNKMTDCTGDLKNSHWNTWCDETGLKICCKDLNNSIWQCPDLATPLFNEPLCNGSTINNKTSGKCPIESGTCHYGHCCPPLIVTGNGTKITLAKRLYQTRFPCDVSLPVPVSFSYAFCNPENSMLVIVGKFHDNGDNLTKVSGKCTLNDECSTDGSSICVHESEDVYLCYYNPLRPLPPLPILPILPPPRALRPVSNFWKIVLIISLACVLIFLIFSIISFIFYHRKKTEKKK